MEHRKTYRYDTNAITAVRKANVRLVHQNRPEVQFIRASHDSSGNPCLKKTTTGTSKVRLSYVALFITSIRFLTLRSAKRAMTGKTCSTRTITKHVRPVVTEALEIFKSLSHNCLKLRSSCSDIKICYVRTTQFY